MMIVGILETMILMSIIVGFFIWLDIEREKEKEQGKEEEEG